MTNHESLLTINGVNVKFGATRVLRGASLEVKGGERVAVIGPSGSGKSTLLYTAIGLIRPQAGTVVLAGNDLAAMSDRKLSALRRQMVGFVFQFGHLIQDLTITENVAMPLMANGQDKRSAKRRAAELIRQFELNHLADRFPDQVSGGELQRIAVARAAAHRPAIIVADEPTGALDSKSGDDVLRMLNSVTGPGTGAALVMVTHDPHVAAGADRVIRVKDGRTTLRETADL